MKCKAMVVFQYLFIGLLIYTMSGCGFVKTIYNNAPEVVAWWLDDYIHLTSDQQAILIPALNRIHEWHRNTQLPEDIAMLQALQIAVSQGNISTSEACAYIDQIKLRFNVLQVAFVPLISEIAPLISDEQLSYLKQKLDKRAEKWKAQWWQATPAEQLEARVDKIEAFAEKVYGNISAKQREQIRQKLLAYPTQPAIFYNEINRRNADVIQTIIALKHSQLNEIKQYALIQAAFGRLELSPDKAYQSHADSITQRTCEMVSVLHSSADAFQKQHASNWFGNILNQFLD